MSLFKKQSSKNLVWIGLAQALGVAVYCYLVGLFMINGEHIFKDIKYLVPMVLLTLLSFSILFCGTLVFYKPYKLFMANKKSEAAELVLKTVMWLFAFLVIFFLAVAI